MLSAAVVTDHAAQLQIRQLVHELGERDRLIASRHAAARPDRDIDHDVCGYARLLRRIVQIQGVLGIVDRLDELAIRLPDGHRPSNLVRRHVRGRHQNRFDAIGREHLGLADLRGADADRSAGELQLRNSRAFVGFGVRPARHLHHGQALAHGRDVLFQFVEIDAQGGCVEVPLRDADQRLFRSWHAPIPRQPGRTHRPDPGGVEESPSRQSV